VLLALAEDYRIFVEVNPDIYGLAPNAFEDLLTLADSSGISGAINWRRVKEALERKEGVARDVTLGSGSLLFGFQQASICPPGMLGNFKECALYAANPRRGR
jgi:hypothetical protein